MEFNYIRVRNSNIKYYNKVPLYTKHNGRYLLYKPGGITLAQMRVREQRYPSVLYISGDDRLEGIQEAQKGFNRQIETHVRTGDIKKMKAVLIDLMEETLSEPRSGSLEGVSETMDILVREYASHNDIVNRLVDMSYTDYSTVLHSINVMAFALGFASFLGYSQEETKILGLCSLLHDVGKTKIEKEILVAPRMLTLTEFEEMKRHTTIGFDLLRTCKFEDRRISLTALEHHEKLDGSGYPLNKRSICETAQIVGLIDCYEALTNDERPYRRAAPPFDVLKDYIGRDVIEGKFSKQLYACFVKSIGAFESAA